MKSPKLKIKGRIREILLIILITALLFSSCGQSTTNGANEIPPDECDFSASKRAFDINDVTLTFYYGGVFSSDIELERENGRNIPYVELYFADEDWNKHFIRRTEDHYISEKYRITGIRDENDYVVEYLYNHSENITIPRELFTKSSGAIYFAVYGEELNGNYPMRCLTSVKIHYMAMGETVVVSHDEFRLLETLWLKFRYEFLEKIL